MHFQAGPHMVDTWFTHGLGTDGTRFSVRLEASQFNYIASGKFAKGEKMQLRN
jgi:hypothetical protein